MTVGGERDEVKPNGKNWLNSYSNRLAIPDQYLPSAGRLEPSCDQGSLGHGRLAGAQLDVVTLWCRLLGVM